MSDNIFGGVDNTNQPPVTPPANSLDTKLDEIRDADGRRKYDSIEKALDALKHSQEYIPTLQAQLKEKERILAEQTTERERVASLEDIIAKLTAQQSAPPQVETPASGGLDEQTVVELVKQTLNKTSEQQVYASNEASVTAALKAKYGDKAAEIVTQKAAELGISTQDVQELSRKSPALVLTAFGIQANKPTMPTPQGSSVYIPPINKPDPEIKRPEKSVLSGASMKEQGAHFSQIREAIYAKHGVTT